MRQEKPRVGIYGSVPRHSAVFKNLVRILGYDPFDIKEVASDETIKPYCGRAKTFGPHFTIYDIFTPTHYNDLLAKLKEILKGEARFDFSFDSFSGYVRGDYQGKSVYNDKSKTVLALDFDNDSCERIQKIHELVIKNIQQFRERIEPEFSSDIFRNTPELWALIQKYGAPYVLANFSPHLTVASKLDGSEALLEKLINYLETEYGGRLLNIKMSFDRVYIFEEIKGGKFNGYFKVKDEIKLNE